MNERNGLTVFAAECGLAGAILFPVVVIVAGLREPGYSFLNNATSDLGAIAARYPLPYNVGLAASGLLTIGLGLALFRFLPRARPAIAGSVFVVVFGIGQFIDALAREDCSVVANSGSGKTVYFGNICRDQVIRQFSTHHRVHDIESLVTFSALLLAPLALGLCFRSIPSLEYLVPWAFRAAAFQAVYFAVFLYLFESKHSRVGVAEILGLATGIAWLIAIAIVIVQRGGVLEPEGAGGALDGADDV